MSGVWIALAALGGIMMLFGLVRFVQSVRPQPGMSEMPMTPLETLGWVGVGITGAVGVGMALLVGIVGVTAFHEEPTARFTFWLLLVGGIGIWALAWSYVRRRSGGIVVDERDRAILARSFSVESMLVLLSLVAWTIALTEVFWDEGSVPIAYLQLLFWTTFILGALGRSLGIILGYRREIDVDA